jgi:uncharacterized membrane protein YdcZ (DUF606 family)
MVKLLIAILSFLSGVASSTQGLYNGYWKESIDLKTVMLVNAVVLFIAVLLFYFLTGNSGLRPAVDKMDPSILVGGLCGFFIIMIFAIAFPEIGATATSLLFISGLLSASLLYDHIGALNLAATSASMQKLIGIIMVVAGSYIALRNPA